MAKPKCENCNKEFTKKAQLSYHIKHKSCKIRDFSCKYCDKGFTTDEAVHFNPKYPEYHNVYISNIKDKYAMMYDGKEWSLTRKTELIDRLYENKKNYIEDNMEYFLETLSKSQIWALERWLNIDDEHDKIKEVKDKIKLLLYNKRDVVIESIYNRQ